MVNRFVQFIGLLTLFSNIVFAQSNQDLLLHEIKSAYEQLNYAEAEIKGRSALESYSKFSPGQLSEIHQILGLIYYSQNKIDSALEQFESALSINPKLKLDPVFVSPKILAFFKQVKRDVSNKKSKRSDSQHEVRYIMLDDVRPAAAVRSMVWPGWGHLYKGEKTKGRILALAWGLSIAGTLGSHLARQNAQDKYLSETNPQNVQSRFDSFNNLHKVRNSLVILSTGIWLYSYWDALIRKSPRQRQIPAATSQSFQLYPSFSNMYAGIHLRMNL